MEKQQREQHYQSLGRSQWRHRDLGRSENDNHERCFAMSAITALVAQGTTGVREIVEMSPEFLGQRIDTVFEDIPPDAVKMGMVASCGLTRGLPSGCVSTK